MAGDIGFGEFRDRNLAFEHIANDGQEELAVVPGEAGQCVECSAQTLNCRGRPPDSMLKSLKKSSYISCKTRRANSRLLPK